MTEAEFWQHVADSANPSWRLGQTAFNVLFSLRPDLSEQVRGTNLDPFYAHSEDNPQMVEFRRFVHEHWDDPHHLGQMVSGVITCDCGWTGSDGHGETFDPYSEGEFNAHVRDAS